MEKWITFHEDRTALDKELVFNNSLQDVFNNPKIIQYYDMLCESTVCFNVMSKHELEKGFEHFVRNHIFDALSMLYCIDDWENKVIIDIGSGTGIPGLPIYILRNERKTGILLESKGKKAEFLTKIVENLSLTNINIISERAEIAARQEKFRQNVDISLIRAVGSIEESLELSLPFIKIGGLSVLYRGELSAEERQFSTTAGGKFGGKLHNIVSYSLKDGQKIRNLLIFEKIEDTDQRYPRRPGVPRKKSKNFKSS